MTRLRKSMQVMRGDIIFIYEYHEESHVGVCTGPNLDQTGLENRNFQVWSRSGPV